MLSENFFKVFTSLKMLGNPKKVDLLLEKSKIFSQILLCST